MASNAKPGKGFAGSKAGYCALAKLLLRMAGHPRHDSNMREYYSSFGENGITHLGYSRTN